MRKITFTNGGYYHIYNRGANKASVFLDSKDYWKFFDGLRDFNNATFYGERLRALGLSIRSRNGKRPGRFPFRELGDFLGKQKRFVDIISYNLIGNHYHIIAKQLEDGGVSNFMHKLGLAFSQYFNEKYEHSGHVFQGPFKAVEIRSDEYFFWLLGYVNGNIEIHGIDKAKNYEWSSYQAICKYLNGEELSSLSALSGPDELREHFKGAKEFEDLVQKVVKEAKEDKEIEKKMKKYLLEKQM